LDTDLTKDIKWCFIHPLSKDKLDTLLKRNVNNEH
jgi:hypothetical protein